MVEEKETEKKETKTKTKEKVKEEKPKQDENIKVQIRDVVVPGEVLAEGMGYIPSDGAFRDKDVIRSNVLGLVNVKGRVLKVIPLSGRYMPHQRDVVIGVISEIRHSGWLVDINSPYMGSISLSEGVDRFVKKGEDLSKYYAIGDTVLAEVVDSSDITHLTMRAPGLRKLKEGRIIDVKPAKVPRLIGKNGSMIKVIREGTGCSIIVGRNGKVWLKGTLETEQKAISAINMIDRESHTSGLTDRVREYLEMN